MANRVFEDRLGCWIVADGSGQVAPKLSRLPALRALGVVDVFLPRESQPADFQTVRNRGMGAHLYLGADPSISAEVYAQRFLAEYKRLGSKGAGELNIELPSDPPLADYLERVVARIRLAKPNLPLRLNVAPFKAQFLPLARLLGDPHLYACEQSFYGDMSRVSEADALYDLLSWGVPLLKATVCYGAAALVPDPTIVNPTRSPRRVVGLGTRWTWSNGAVVGQLKRGVIFQDDLLGDVELI